jgi:hypothetical protein
MTSTLGGSNFDHGANAAVPAPANGKHMRRNEIWLVRGAYDARYDDAPDEGLNLCSAMSGLSTRRDLRYSRERAGKFPLRCGKIAYEALKRFATWSLKNSQTGSEYAFRIGCLCESLILHAPSKWGRLAAISIVVSRLPRV